MSDKLAYLGWGIIGTPKGRQAVGDGVDKSLGLAKNFDLAQEFGGCLPEPKQDPDFSEVLYCLSLQKAGEYNVLGLSEYRPAYEQGQSRAGSYFGSFIEVVSHSFGEASLSKLFATLYKLSQFQFHAFIDPDTRNYKESISGKTLQAPEADLWQIAEQIQPLTVNLLSQTAMEEALFVQCGKGNVVEALKTLLNEQLYYRFKHIYFTESDYISAQMQNKKIAKLHLSYLENGKFFTDCYRKEILYLHQQNGQYRYHLQKVEQDLATEKANQAQQVALQVQQQTAEVKAQFQQEINTYKDRAEEAEGLRPAAKLGQEIRELCKNAENLDRAKSEWVSNEQLDKKLQEIDGVLKTLLQRSNLRSPQKMQQMQETQSEVQMIEQKQPPNWLFAGLAGFFALILLGIGVYSLMFSEEPQQSDPKIELELKEMKVKLQTAEDKLQESEDELKALRNQPQTSTASNMDEMPIIERFITELCKANPSDSRKLDTPNAYKEKLGEGKLCTSSK